LGKKESIGMKEKFYITTAIDYVNAAPHLGHVLEKVQADVIARYERLLGKEVYFLIGTDEHGAKNVRAAEEAGQDIKNFIDENAAKFQEVWKNLAISNDDFIRTSDQKRHWPATQAIWKKLEKAGDIYKANYKGLYCLGCEAFITEKDLIDGKCVNHGREPELIEEENYFFRLSRYTKEIESRIKNNELRIIPETRRNEILALLEEGLEDVSFSRPAKDISWGIPVPGDASQTMYVWLDALSNYLSALGLGAFRKPLAFGKPSKFKKFWPADLHVIGKDILRFHAGIWPGILLSVKLPLPKAILVHGFITVGGKKMSKTLGNVVDPLALIEESGAEAARFYLAKAISIFEDGDFTEEKFKKIYNADLANGLGNFISRTAAMIAQYFNGIISKPDDLLLAKVPFLHSLGVSEEQSEGFSIPYAVEHLIRPEYKKLMDGFELHSALNLVWRFLAELDKYVQDYQPFKLIKTDKEKTQAVLWSLAFGAVSVAWLIKPFLPETSDKILKIFGVPKDKKGDWQKFKITLPKQPLFPRKD